MDKAMIEMSYLRDAQEYWDEWRFLPWSDGTASGLYRRVDFIKAGLIGEIARYQADDYIVWTYEEEDLDRLFRDAKPEKNLMVQRYVFVRPEGITTFKNKAFTMGVNGFVEIYQDAPLSRGVKPATLGGRLLNWGVSLFKRSPSKQIADLCHLIDAAHLYSLRHAGQPKSINTEVN